MIVVKLPLSTLQLPWIASRSFTKSYDVMQRAAEWGVHHQLEPEVYKWLVSQGHSGRITTVEQINSPGQASIKETPCVTFSDDQHDMAMLFKLTWGGA